MIGIGAECTGDARPTLASFLPGLGAIGLLSRRGRQRGVGRRLGRQLGFERGNLRGQRGDLQCELADLADQLAVLPQQLVDERLLLRQRIDGLTSIKSRWVSGI